ncbi:MAG: serine/threonine protein kinase [Planctomycetes bacterium]|nr:serine/threonine protein kinase [Planctomycetota bacterium]
MADVSLWNPDALAKKTAKLLTNLGAVVWPGQGTREEAAGDLLATIRRYCYPPPDTIAALKVPHRLSDQGEEQNARARLKREAAAMRKVRHPHSIRLLDHDADGDGGWFVMELLAGGTLAARRAEYTGRVKKTLGDIRGVIEAVVEVHAQRFVHRDVKPKNIFVTADGRLVLGDFGIVFTNDEDHTRLTAPGDSLGSRDWIPPWRRFRNDDWDPGDDVFMLGKVIYWMLALPDRPNVDPSTLNDAWSSLSNQFPERAEIQQIWNILARIIVPSQTAAHRMQDAQQFLQMIDGLLRG